MATDTARLRELRANATQGPWELQDGCSWRRIGTREHDGNVLCPTNCRHDGHPDLQAGRGEDAYANLHLIVAAVNSLPALLDEVDRLRAAEADWAIERAIGQRQLDELREALAKIERWEMPETGSFWDKAKTSPMSYAACYGSNGERDVIRQIARLALEPKP